MFASLSKPGWSVCLWGLLAAALAVQQTPSLNAATNWKALVGAQSHDKGHQALAFLPNELWIRAGDSITWTFNVDEIHTVSFLKSGQTRLPFPVGCPGVTPSPAVFNDSACVTTPPMVKGQTYTVTFPTPGNFKLVCLVHANMTGVVHVLPAAAPLPHNQAFYNAKAADEARDLLTDDDNDDHHGDNDDHHHGDRDGGHDRDHDRGRDSHHHANHGPNIVAAGVGEISANAGGTSTLSIMRFIGGNPMVIRKGQTVEWDNDDPVTPHTITFGVEPADPMPPSAGLTTDADGALHATINSPADSAHSGFIVASLQDQIGHPQTPLGTTRFRVTFTQAGVFPYICALHDDLGMTGKIIVLP